MMMIQIRIRNNNNNPDLCGTRPIRPKRLCNRSRRGWRNDDDETISTPWSPHPKS